MLIMTFTKQKGIIYTPNVYFEDIWEESWFNDEFAKQAIEGIDKSVVISPHCIQSPVLGQIPPTYLSGGVKTVLLVKNIPDVIFNGSACGDNCAKWLIKACEGREQKVFFWHRLRLDGCQGMTFEIKFEETGQVVRTVEEYNRVFTDLIIAKKLPI